MTYTRDPVLTRLNRTFRISGGNSAIWLARNLAYVLNTPAWVKGYEKYASLQTEY